MDTINGTSYDNVASREAEQSGGCLRQGLLGVTV